MRRTEYDLKKAEARAHILEGLRVALDHLDEVISIIRSSQTTDIARDRLIERFGLSNEQTQAILEMRLQRLTGLEREKIENEYQELMVKIAEYKEILANQHLVLEIISNELIEIKERFADERRTEITIGEESILDEDLIPREEVVITITHTGLRQTAVYQYVPQPKTRRTRRRGDGYEGRGFRRAFVRHQLPPLPDVLYRSGQGVPA